jgi:hypothetical protein
MLRMQSLRVITILLSTLMLSLTFAVQAESEIKIKFASLDKINNDYQLNVDYSIVLNPTLEKALKNGVPLYFATRFGLAKPRWYWVDEEVARSKIRVELSYYALTRRYRLSHGAWMQSFNTLPEALHVLSQLRDYPVVVKSRLESGVEYVATLRVWLDLQRLPKPFQVETIGSTAWYLTSRRLEWRTRLPLSTQPLYQQGDL